MIRLGEMQTLRIMKKVDFGVFVVAISRSLESR